MEKILAILCVRFLDLGFIPGMVTVFALQFYVLDSMVERRLDRVIDTMLAILCVRFISLE